MTGKIINNIEQLDRQQKETNFENSLKYAELLQQGIFPKQRHFDRIFSESFILFKPLQLISGDFYWLAESNGLIYLIVGDCTGHGAPGAILSVLISGLFDYVILNKQVKKTHKILREVDNRFIESFSSPEIKNKFNNDWVDVSLCCIEPETKTIYFSGAKRNALIINEKGTKVLKGCPYSIGGWQMESNRQYGSTKLKYKKGDMLYLGTDGFQDQKGGASGKRYKASTLHKFIADNAKHKMNSQKELLNDELKQWMGEYKQTDDICIVGVKL